MKKSSSILLGLMIVTLLTIVGCGDPKTGIDLRGEGMVMKIPLQPLEGKVFVVEQIKGGGFKLEDQTYDINSVIETLDSRPFIFKTGICLKTVGDMKQESEVIDRFATFCVQKNINLFLDMPHQKYIAKPENLDWIVQRKQ